MILSRPLLIFVVAMWLFLSILEWKDNFSKKPVINQWAIIDDVVTLVPNPSMRPEQGNEANISADGKQFDLE